MKKANAKKINFIKNKKNDKIKVYFFLVFE